MFSLVLDIATTASILFSVAAGLLVVLGVLKIVNFAHGAFLVIGAYSALVVTWLGLNPWFAYPVAFFFGAIIGAVIERLVVRPIYNRPLDAILATWGLSIVIGQLITIGFGREIQFVQTPIAGAITMFGETYSQYRLFLVLAAVVVAGGNGTRPNPPRLGPPGPAGVMKQPPGLGRGAYNDWGPLSPF